MMFPSCVYTFIANNVSSDQLIIFSCYGFLSSSYYSIKLIINYFKQKFEPEPEPVPESEQDPEPESEPEIVLEPESEQFLDFNSELEDETYVQPNVYSLKLRKRRRKN